MALNDCWKFPCSGRERGRPGAGGSPFLTQHYHLVDTGCSPRLRSILATASTRDNLARPLADVFTGEWTSLSRVPDHCSHTSQAPQKDTLKIHSIFQSYSVSAWHPLSFFNLLLMLPTLLEHLAFLNSEKYQATVLCFINILRTLLTCFGSKGMSVFLNYNHMKPKVKSPK